MGAKFRFSHFFPCLQWYKLVLGAPSPFSRQGQSLRAFGRECKFPSNPPAPQPPSSIQSECCSKEATETDGMPLNKTYSWSLI